MNHELRITKPNQPPVPIRYPSIIPVSLAQTRTNIVQIMWNRRAQCCICGGRNKPSAANMVGRMIYRHSLGEEFIYCVPCAAMAFGIGQERLLEHLMHRHSVARN